MKFVMQLFSLGVVFVCCVDSLFAEVAVQTVDGRELIGEVDAETDDTHLWIRQTSDNILLTTSVAWKSIASATQEGKELPLDQLSTLLRKQVAGEPVGFLIQQTVYKFPDDCTEGCLPAVVPALSVASRPVRRVRSLSIDAYLVNLDRDVEADGFELLITALDEQGVAVPVRGSVFARLWGGRDARRSARLQFSDLETWTEPVAPKHFVDGVASYTLRFRNTRPELDLLLSSGALLNVRLGVFGQGNFSASVPVRVREFNPVRDQLQIRQGGRFFPGEVTSRHLPLQPLQVFPQRN